MPSPRLTNYLRSHRKRAALSQAELAFLLGARSGAKVCRYERSARAPNLETVFAYEIIFNQSGRELFPKLYERIERDIAARAKVLRHRVARRPARRTRKQQQLLTRLAARQSITSNQTS